MMGCLTAPFKLLGCLVLLLALGLGWLYRDRLVTEVRHRIGQTPSSAAAPVGRPGTKALASARSKIDSLNGWRADSILLTPSEVASLIGAGLAPGLRSRLDSLEVSLRGEELVVRARLKTDRLPKELVGPLAIALQPTERVEAGGPVAVAGAGRAEWTVRSFRIRNVPFPSKVVPALVERAFGASPRRTVPIRIPEGIGRIRLRSSGATVYGASRP